MWPKSARRCRHESRHGHRLSTPQGINPLLDYRLANGAHYIALDALIRLDDLACRLEACRSLSHTSRRRLSSITDDVAATMDAVLASAERLPERMPYPYSVVRWKTFVIRMRP